MQSPKSLELGTNSLAYWSPVAKSKTVLSGLGGKAVREREGEEGEEAEGAEEAGEEERTETDHDCSK